MTALSFSMTQFLGAHPKKMTEDEVLVVRPCPITGRAFLCWIVVFVDKAFLSECIIT
jgi:hypothetical protein